MPASYERVALDDFPATLFTLTELSSVALGGTVNAVSDEFFAESSNLLKVEAAPSLKGQFGPKGALYSGWETRRHNPSYDWCTIRLGCAGQILGFDVDTSHFNGNEAPQVSVDALLAPEGASPLENDIAWTEILPKVDLGPDSRHLFKITTNGASYSHVKLNMYPDGGIARFRVYGLVSAVLPSDARQPFDLAHVRHGGRVVAASDQHFGQGSNLILPGRGKDMGDGWETKRSRQKDHTDWAIIMLGKPGYLQTVEIDTAHFKGNFPESCELHGLLADDTIPSPEQMNWTVILPRTKLGPHRQHFFQLINVSNRYSHVRMTIYPDGGVKRIRLIGSLSLEDVTKPFHGTTSSVMQETNDSTGSPSKGLDSSGRQGRSTPALPITPEAFAPYGQVLMAWADIHAAPRGTTVTEANLASATKFHMLSKTESSYPSDLLTQANASFSIYRCQPMPVEFGSSNWEVKVLERHPHTNQAFIPMGTASSNIDSDALNDLARAYLVVVAHNGVDDRPDVNTLRAFIVPVSKGVVYNTTVWHHPMIALEKAIDFTCVETQIGGGHELDCEVVKLDVISGLPRISLPSF